MTTVVPLTKGESLTVVVYSDDIPENRKVEIKNIIAGNSFRKYKKSFSGKKRIMS